MVRDNKIVRQDTICNHGQFICRCARSIMICWLLVESRQFRAQTVRNHTVLSLAPFRIRLAASISCGSGCPFGHKSARHVRDFRLNSWGAGDSVVCGCVASGSILAMAC